MTDTNAPDPTTLRRIYLNDHRAGGAGALALIGRMISSNEGTALCDTLASLRSEVRDDATALEAVMRELGAAPNPGKMLAARAAEIFGRLKPNGRLRGYSPLSRVLEIEALMAAIDMKRRLWETLQGVAGADHVGGVDLVSLMRRADAQRERLRSHHEEAVVAAFGDGAVSDGVARR